MGGKRPLFVGVECGVVLLLCGVVTSVVVVVDDEAIVFDAVIAEFVDTGAGAIGVVVVVVK